ncbi:hypothetical protein [Streptomyces violarus]|uniref:hypothetical protein n=1 Tax=Streptomyces violarus TaxID=67380 RepID=UPI0021C1CFF9|nr:hypothetical protein [Streptomyces violarus]MCT9137843.1 hypothetical protein [Streptomyces violarus]
MRDTAGSIAEIYSLGTGPHVQAETAVDPAVTGAQREFAGAQALAFLRGVPDLAAVALLVAALDS